MIRVSPAFGKILGEKYSVAWTRGHNFGRAPNLMPLRMVMQASQAERVGRGLAPGRVKSATQRCGLMWGLAVSEDDCGYAATAFA